ncbi:ankyrin repeat domain-containing protein [Wolbachia endosymbiont (group A) of Volucella inflata]|uniref:ankyrin repeat domain-containing protein n=1 Tax=Wolbachia endosymbiont (group A) of Volucella inflata TaxID=2954065 RepID=UPI0022266754|nr:ankyrin repeat domain-containing protein [Wolbachia endosymbiont (group A) of Volucella inflata]
MNRATEQLFDAVSNGDLNGVKEALEKGADVSDGYWVSTHLCFALREGYIEIAKLLIENDANVKDGGKQAPLHLAAVKGEIEVAKLLIANDADINARDDDERTPIYYAMIYSNIEVANGANVNSGDRNKHTPLHLTAMFSRIEVEVVKLLIANGANVNAKGDDERTALQIAVGGRNTGTAKCIIEYTLLQNFNAEKPNFLNGNAALSSYWDKCKDETTQMSTYVIGNIRNRNISINDFLTEKDDVKLVSYVGNEGIILQLQELQSNGYKEFPIFADLLKDRIQSRITEGERKKCLYDRIGKLEFKQLPPELMNIVNENLVSVQAIAST